MNQFLHRVLEPPTYGYTQNGKFYKPSNKELITLFIQRMNIFESKKNWLTFFSWMASFVLVIPLFVFLIYFFEWKYLPIAFIYSMVLLGSHGTIYLHRYCSHRSYRIRNSFFRFIIRNLVIKVIPEEIYVISHLVHHKYTEQPGDPYNVHGGWLYCFLADGIHNPISKSLKEEDYKVLSQYLSLIGISSNSYENYQKYGSLTKPLNCVLSYGLNWLFWYSAFYFLGGHALATCIFGATAIWSFGVRTFNFDGHGRGTDKRQEGIDFQENDMSINQIWAGYVAGEWHNNHHLYPNGARAGFLPYQLDLAWFFIYTCFKLKIVTKYNDPKKRFYKEYYIPYTKLKKAEAFAN
jgi:stearoyl-CoA desaturase (delta-9 desaturase)